MKTEPEMDTNVATLTQGDKKVQQEVQDEWPGKLKLATERGHHFGCAANTFATVQEMEDFFYERPNHLITYIGPAINGALHVIWTKVITDTELARFQRVQAKARQLIDEEDQKQKEAEAAAIDATNKAEEERKKAAAEKLKELERLADLGRKCQKHHGKKAISKEGK